MKSGCPGSVGSLWCSPSPPLPPRSPLGQTTASFPCSTLLMLASTWRAKLECEVSWKLGYQKRTPNPNLFYSYCILIFFLLQLWAKSHNGQIWQVGLDTKFVWQCKNINNEPSSSQTRGVILKKYQHSLHCRKVKYEQWKKQLWSEIRNNNIVKRH